MEDKRNIVIAMVIAALILFGWPYLTTYFFPETAKPAAAASSAAAGGTAAAPGAPTAAGAARPVSVTQALSGGQRVAIETPTLRGSVNLTGARIDDLVMLRYNDTVEKDAKPVRLFSPSGTANAYFVGAGWTGQGVTLPNAETVWTAPAGARLTPTTPVTLTWDNGAGQQFAMTLSVDDKYMFNVRQSVTNRGAQAVGVRPYSYLTRKGTSPDHDTWTIHAGAMGVFNNDPEWFDRDEIDESAAATIGRRTTGGWLGFTDHFWLGAIIPDQKTPVDVSFRQAGNGLYQADFMAAEGVVNPGTTRTTTSQVFAGAKETRVLDHYTDAGVLKLEQATDWGWFSFIIKPIFYILDALFRLIGNFGFAIMALTLLIRLIMFPIAQKQFSSMAQMRIVQPKLKALQEKYKDDKPRLQQEMMALYKTEKINPLAGCLPILIQIPIFYSLYKCLMLTVEMRHQPFIAWVKDLSAPDPASLITLFHMWGITLPAFLGIGVMAVLLGITMWAQFRLNPPATDPVQQQMFALMPWIMMFIMAPFAAGLLLYWITNNILTIAQQKLLYSRYPEMKQAMAVK